MSDAEVSDVVGVLLAMFALMLAVCQIVVCVSLWCHGATSSSSSKAASSEVANVEKKKQQNVRLFFKVAAVVSLSSFSVASLLATFYSFVFSIYTSGSLPLDWIVAPLITLFWFCGRTTMTSIFISRLSILRNPSQFISVSVTKCLWFSLAVSCVLFALPLALYVFAPRVGAVFAISVLLSFVFANLWDIVMSVLLNYAFVRGLVALMRNQQLLGDRALLDAITKFTLITGATLLSSSVVMIFASTAWCLDAFHGWTVNVYQFLIIIDSLVNTLGLYVIAANGRHNQVYLKACSTCHYYLQRTIAPVTLPQKVVVSDCDESDQAFFLGSDCDTQKESLQAVLTSVGVGTTGYMACTMDLKANADGHDV